MERTFETASGPIIGRVEDGVVRVLGVPYATANRFELPEPVPPFSEPFQAFDRAPAPPQHRSELLIRLIGDDDLGDGEDCQRLSITAPADLAEGERLPVLVWIHGGSYVTGAGDLTVYDPRSLVGEQRVVVVTVTYRLGVLGFFGDGERVPANLGLLDQLAALRWIRDNILAFGGDPESVTLFGQSAGGDAIAHLMISEGAEGLFRRAIIQSAPLGITSGRAAMTTAMLAAVGDLPPDAPVSDVLAAQRVAEKAAKRFGLPGGMPFGVQYGLPPVPAESTRDEAWRKAAPRIDVLIGCTAEEAALFAGAIPLVERLFRVPLLGAAARSLTTPLSRKIYDTPAAAFARRHRDAGGQAVRYRMTWRPSGSPFGAAHITDLPLILGTRQAWEGARLLGNASWSEVDRRGRAVRAVWAGFARTGQVSAAGAAAARDSLAFPRSESTIECDAGHANGDGPTAQLPS
ncbi:carboxylesterase family protein [Amycolatopsis sp. 195334CR]|uniref:carboxylesterase family protein n=1 Tax=Amycolatopsis sp. 195334CR TaxID=2814588 RepID=UPI001A8D689F|nr:carboxylesterase family protein [Amycolatopsis sp. 195334CR]MBN6037620.1 carboxylesterase family protein [Amycolatopsis sp. 195334CR]